MKRIMTGFPGKLFVSLLISILLVVSLVYVLSKILGDVEKAISSSGIFVQMTAIIMGGYWAYHNFVWEKRAQDAVSAKDHLIEYESCQNMRAMQYRIAEDDNMEEAWKEYALAMIPLRNEFYSKISLLSNLSPKMRDRLLHVSWLSLNNGRSPKNENIDENWKQFEMEARLVKEDLDNLARA